MYSRLEDDWDVVVLGTESGDDYVSIRKIDCDGGKVDDWLYAILENRSLKGLLDIVKKYFRESYPRKAARIIKALAPCIVHVHNDVEAVKPIKIRNARSVVMLHMNNDHLADEYYLQNGVSAEAVQYADKIVCCSVFIQNNIERCFPLLPQGKCIVVHNGADVSEPGQASATDASLDAPNLLFIGRLVPEKGVHLLIEAFGAVVSRFPKASLTIVGGVWFGKTSGSEYVTRLHRIAEPYGDAIHFAGPVSHDAVVAYLARSSAFICPSIWNDPFPLVNLEAMGAGVPVVAFARGGIPEAVGDAGVLVNELTSVALGQAICNLLSDSGELTRLRDAGIERVKRKFSWDVIADQWGEFLNAELA